MNLTGVTFAKAHRGDLREVERAAFEGQTKTNSEQRVALFCSRPSPGASSTREHRSRPHIIMKATPSGQGGGRHVKLANSPAAKAA